MAGDAGLEPTHVAVKVLCLTDLANPLYKVVSAQGFEPRTHALEGRCSIQLSYAPTLYYLERQTRFELATSTLARLRSTAELFPHFKIMVRMKGVEPPRRRRQILSLVRLPIPPHPHFTLYIVGGGWWIRTTESNANRFTVCPLWPLGKSSTLELVIGIEPTTC